MDGEIYFRKAAFGGFNRDDVMCYISELKLKCEAQNEQYKEEAAELDEKVKKLKSELEEKEQELILLRKKVTKLENVEEPDNQAETVDSSADKKHEKTADRLMRESMAYAERYIESAGLMAKNIKQETSKLVSDADERVGEMLNQAGTLSKRADEFKTTLSALKTEFEDILKSFEITE